MLDAVDGFRLLDLLHQARQLRTSPGRPCEGTRCLSLVLLRPEPGGELDGLPQPV